MFIVFLNPLERRCVGRKEIDINSSFFKGVVIAKEQSLNFSKPLKYLLLMQGLFWALLIVQLKGLYVKNIK